MENVLLCGITILTTVLFFGLMDNSKVITKTNRFEQSLRDLQNKD